MIVALDVGYSQHKGLETGTCGIVGFMQWTDDCPTYEGVATVEVNEPYIPGQLFRRELPCLLAGLEEHRLRNTNAKIVVIDGNVRLDPENRPGLGNILYERMGKTTPIIGVAKNLFDGLDPQLVYRGRSSKPLFVSAVGIDEAVAASHIATMAGHHRMPTLLKRADQLSR